MHPHIFIYILQRAAVVTVRLWRWRLEAMSKLTLCSTHPPIGEAI